MGIVLPAHNVPRSQDPCISARPIFTAYSVVMERVNHLFKMAAPTEHGGLQKKGVQISALYLDSRCSDTYGPLAAVRLFYKDKVDVFYGPCCKYALSPVARYATVWQVPVITPGGLTPAFSNKDEFPMLTRIRAPYDKLADFLLSVLRQFEWQHIGLLWHDNLLVPSLGKSECYHSMSAVIDTLRSSQTASDPFKESFDENRFNLFSWEDILLGISNHSRSKYNLIFMFSLALVAIYIIILSNTI